MSQIVDVWKRQAAMEEDGLNGLFGALLGIEAEIFQINARHTTTSALKVASGAVEPFAWIGRPQPLTRHKGPVRPEERGKSPGTARRGSAAPRRA